MYNCNVYLLYPSHSGNYIYYLFIYYIYIIGLFYMCIHNYSNTDYLVYKNRLGVTVR